MMTRKLSFEKWTARVNEIVVTKLGLGLDDLPDCPTADWYADGMTASQAAREAVAMARE